MDTRRPAAILKEKTGKTAHALTLTFTAPGDDFMVGRATRYDVRWSRHRITNGNFRRAHRIRGVALPAPGGTNQTLKLAGLPRGRIYLAIRTIDDAGNISALGRTLRLGAAP